MKIINEILKQAKTKNIETMGMMDIADLRYNAKMGEDAALDYIAEIAQECDVAQELLSIIDSNQKLN